MPVDDSVGVLRMSPRRCTETLVCWKLGHSCARRMIGCATRPASMLKAISWPTESCPSITSRAPSHNVASVTSLPISPTPSLASVERNWVLKLAAT
ncbi:hypothetical protein D3C71_1909110 [compost metagenome]